MALELNGTTGVSLVQDGAITDANLPAGSVLQVVQGVLTGINVSSSSSSFADTGITAAITPSSASNKILVLINIGGLYKTTSNTYAQFKVLRGATDIVAFENLGGFTNASDSVAYGSISCCYLDSPATTTSTTYKVQFASGANAASVSFNTSPNGSITTTSTITLMEIAA